MCPCSVLHSDRTGIPPLSRFDAQRGAIARKKQTAIHLDHCDLYARQVRATSQAVANSFLTSTIKISTLLLVGSLGLVILNLEYKRSCRWPFSPSRRPAKLLSWMILRVSD